MPIWLRRFTFQEINDFYEKEKQELEKAYGKEQLSAESQPNMLSKNNQVKLPDFVSKVKRTKK
jgi:hypothetical protein